MIHQFIFPYHNQFTHFIYLPALFFQPDYALFLFLFILCNLLIQLFDFIFPLLCSLFHFPIIIELGHIGKFCDKSRCGCHHTFYFKIGNSFFYFNENLWIFLFKENTLLRKPPSVTPLDCSFLSVGILYGFYIDNAFSHTWVKAHFFLIFADRNTYFFHLPFIRMRNKIGILF